MQGKFVENTQQSPLCQVKLSRKSTRNVLNPGDPQDFMLIDKNEQLVLCFTMYSVFLYVPGNSVWPSKDFIVDSHYGHS